MIAIVDVDNSTVVLSHRLTPYNTPPFEKGIPVKYCLTEALLVGNISDQVIICWLIDLIDWLVIQSIDQVKCTELSIDMFWMLQTLEREPHDDLLQQHQPVINMSMSSDSSPAPGGRAPYVSDPYFLSCWITWKSQSNFKDDVFTRGSGKENPHKYLLYKPTLSQLQLFLTSGRYFFYFTVSTLTST